MATKIRVHELAKELGKDSKTLVAELLELGFSVKTASSTLDPDQADVVRRRYGGTVPPRTPDVAAPASRPSARAPAPDPDAGRGSSSSAIVVRRKAAGPRPAEKDAAAAAEEARAKIDPAPSRPSGPVIVRAAEGRRGDDAAETPARGGAGAFGGEHTPRSADAGSGLRPHAGPADGGGPWSGRLGDGDDGRADQAGDDAEDTSSGEAAGAAMPVHSVGTRIELPRGTRRLPGGMADRLAQAPRPAPVAPPPPPVVTPPPVAAPAARPIEAPATSASPGASAEGVAPAARAVVEDDGRVIRNEEGVIVGIRTKQQGPRVVDFIQLEPRRPAQRQQVIITEAAKGGAAGRATARKLREEKAQSVTKRKKIPLRGVKGRGPPPARSTAEMSEAKKRIRVDEVIQVADLAHQMGQKAPRILRSLWGMGLRNVTINSTIDAETAELIAAEFGYSVENVAFTEEEVVGIAIEEGEGELRAPVVTVMGHVDHGKTSLLDRIRKADVAGGEAGGITQHIGAYKVRTAHGDVVFLDTPGHEAFSAMRARGALVTDIVVIVVAADDGVMPTTREAIKHAQEASTQIIVAINKIDKPEANPGRVKQMLMEYGLVGEEFGGDTSIIEVSAKTGQGVAELLELLALQAEVMDLRAPSDGRASGTVIEARLDKGRGPMATVLVQSGTLRRGDVLVASEFVGKVRGVFDDKGQSVEEAGPGTPVEVLGLDGVPSAGDRFDVVESEKNAKQLIGHRREKRRRKETVKQGPSVLEMIAKKKTPTLKVLLRADVQGSAEAVKDLIENLSTEKVRVDVISAGVGSINESDVRLAHAGGATIIGFNVRPVGKAGQQAESDKVPIHLFSVIYEATDKVRDMMIDLLEPEYRERELGEAEVRALFPIPRLGVVAGCRVMRGKITRNAYARVKRQGKVLHVGKIGSLRVFKDDVKEVGEGFECGIVVENFPDVQPEDRIEAYELETLRPTL